MIPVSSDSHPARGASIIALLAGLWFFVSPWVYGAYGNADAWNSWIVGGLIFLLALIQEGKPGAVVLSWFNVILGAWTFASPWVYGYTGNTGRFINSLGVGVIVFCAALVCANSGRISHGPMPTGSAPLR